MPRSLKVPDHKANLNEQDERYPDAARGSEPIDSTPFFGLEVEKHDDEKKQHHHGACIHQHLNDSDKEGIKRHEKSGQPKKRNNEAERARDRITIDDNAGAEDQRHQRKDPKEERRHNQLQIADRGLRILPLGNLLSDF